MAPYTVLTGVRLLGERIGQAVEAARFSKD
jgi:hypothetical protein